MAKKITYDLFGKLQLATIERQVEDAYNEGISLFFPGAFIEYPFACDGFLTDGLMLRLIIEYKYDEKLTNAVAQAKVLAQVLFYMKRFEDNGLALPNVIMVGDKNECFVIHASDIADYLDEKDVDWDAAPSEAGDKNPILVGKIATDENICPYIFRIEKGFDFKAIADRILDLSVNKPRFIRVTEHNIAEIFDNFTASVLRQPEALTPHDLVEVFLGILLDPEHYYPHPSKKDILVANGAHYRIFADAYRAFFAYYNRTYSPKEKMLFTEIADRLVEDTTRRRSGEFFTPTPFVNYAHRMLARHFGEEWRERYAVWDASCGTKNLTRDYRFKNLFCSTLNENDLRLSKGYNQEANSFVFDFLNAPLESLPAELWKVFEDNRPIITFQNPPYGRAGKSKDGDGTMGVESGAAKTAVNLEMIAAGMGKCSANLYAQFMYRIMMIKRRFHLTNFKIGLFSPTLFFSGSTFRAFRNEFLSEFRLIDAVQFQASHFADVKANWGIAFTVWECGVTENTNDFTFTLIDRGEEGKIVTLGTTRVYNLRPGEDLGTWVRAHQCTGEEMAAPNFKSAIRVDESSSVPARSGMLGTILNASNNIDQNATGVSMFSGVGYKGGNGRIFIGRDNFLHACAFFAAKKLIACDWINSKTEYSAPNEAAAGFDEFCHDAIIYSIFNPACFAVSMRNVAYRGNEYNVNNELFFMSRDEMMELANDNSNEECFTDARTDQDRFLFQYLQEHLLSYEAAAVLDCARDLVKSSFSLRPVFDMEHPEFQVNNWDAGWYQVKAILKQYDKSGLNKFEELYKVLAEKIRPMVYKLGFLR